MEITMNKNFTILNENSLYEIDGGVDLPSVDLITLIFNIGQALGKAIGDAIWG